MNNKLQQFPEAIILRKIERDEGEIFNVAGVLFTWKVKGEDTGGALSIYEQELQPGDGVPLHRHGYSEVFYVLSGNVDFLRVTNAGEEWLACAGGETIIIPIDVPHAFYNRTEKPARLLSISTPLHEAFFDAVRETDRADPLVGAQAMARIGELAQRFDTHFFPFSPPPRRR